MAWSAPRHLLAWVGRIETRRRGGRRVERGGFFGTDRNAETRMPEERKVEGCWIPRAHSPNSATSPRPLRDLSATSPRPLRDLGVSAFRFNPNSFRLGRAANPRTEGTGRVGNPGLADACLPARPCSRAKKVAGCKPHCLTEPLLDQRSGASRRVKIAHERVLSNASCLKSLNLESTKGGGRPAQRAGGAAGCGGVKLKFGKLNAV